LKFALMDCVMNIIWVVACTSNTWSNARSKIRISLFYS